MKSWNEIINGISRRLINENLERKKSIILMLESNGFSLSETKLGYNVCNNSTNIYLRKNSSDIKVFEQIIIKKEYESVFSILELNNKTPKFIIDCGANIGLTAIQGAEQFPNCNIICVEPDINNYNQLLKNTKQYKNIATLQTAIWNKKTELVTDRSFRDGQDWSVTTRESNVKDNNTIESITINELVYKYNIKIIDLLKIDIEGAEQYIFNDENDLNFLQITSTIAIEIHDEFKIREKIYEILRKYNFTLINSGELTIGIK